MDRAFRQRGYDPRKITALQRLAYLGDRGLGALSYRPNLGFFQEDNHDLEEIIALGNAAVREFEGQESDLLHYLLQAGGSGGARPKLSLVLDSNGCYHTHTLKPFGPDIIGKPVILKLTSGQFALGHNESLVEYLYLNIAKAAGIEVPDCELLSTGDGRYWLQLTRFDCQADNGRVHTLSAAGLLDASFREPSLDYIDLIKATKLLCGAKEAYKMAQRSLFNYLLCNQDDHAKNHAFQMDDAGNWRLSPAYDLVYSLSVYGEHMTAFSGNGSQLDKRGLQQMAGHLGLANIKPLIHSAEAIYQATSDFTADAKNLGIPPVLISEIRQRIDQNWQTFTAL